MHMVSVPSVTLTFKLAPDTFSCQDEHLCYVILKSHYAGQSFGLDTSVSLYSIYTKFTWSV